MKSLTQSGTFTATLTDIGVADYEAIYPAYFHR